MRTTPLSAAFVIVIALLLAAHAALANDRADDRIVTVEVRDARDLAVIAALGGEPLTCKPRAGTNSVLIDAAAIPTLADAGLRPTVIDADPHGSAELVRRRALGSLARGDNADWWADYKPLDAIYAKMQEMQTRRPDLVEIFEFGRSFQDRPLYAMRITAPFAQNEHCRPAVLLNSLIHAREWVPPMANMWVAETLVANYDSDPAIRDLVDRVEWVFVPVLNPDGYHHTWTESRFWRKNMNDNEFVNQRYGVDLNRNFGVGWGLNRGSSRWPGSNTYRGTAPFSEPESSAIRDLAVSMPQLRVHNDMHSYSELILYPQGFVPDLTPDDSTFAALAEEMQQRIAGYRGNVFEFGPVYTAIYPVSGGTTDWFYTARRAFSFSYELGTAFDPQPSEIRLISEETLSATLLHAEFAADNFGFRADINNDCRHNFADIAAFLDAYVALLPEADFDGSGTIEPGDLTAFIDALVARR